MHGEQKRDKANLRFQKGSCRRCRRIREEEIQDSTLRIAARSPGQIKEELQTGDRTPGKLCQRSKPITIAVHILFYCSRASGTDPALLYRSQAENLVGLAWRCARLRFDAIVASSKGAGNDRSVRCKMLVSRHTRPVLPHVPRPVGPGEREALKLELKGCALAVELAHARLAMAGNRGFCGRSRVLSTRPSASTSRSSNFSETGFSAQPSHQKLCLFYFFPSFLFCFRPASQASLDRTLNSPQVSHTFFDCTQLVYDFQARAIQARILDACLDPVPLLACAHSTSARALARLASPPSP